MVKKFKNKFRIEPNRLQYWDYSSPGSYFITINSKGRKHIFGSIHDGIMILSKHGKIVENEFYKIENYHLRASLDVFVIMPDHVHCIITLSEYDKMMDDITVIKQNRELSEDEIKQYRRLRRNMILVKILGKFQQQTSKHINIDRDTPGTSNWQHDYHDHVIRNNYEYQRIKNYIINNPKKWDEDRLL